MSILSAALEPMWKRRVIQNNQDQEFLRLAYPSTSPQRLRVYFVNGGVGYIEPFGDVVHTQKQCFGIGYIELLPDHPSPLKLIPRNT